MTSPYDAEPTWPPRPPTTTPTVPAHPSPALRRPTPPPVPLRVARELLNPARPRAIGGLSIALTVLLSIDACLALLLANASFERAGLLREMVRGGAIRDARIIFDSPVPAPLALATLLAVGATVVVMLVWAWRFVKNSDVLSNGRGPSAGWFVAACVIPLAGVLIQATVLMRADRLADTRGKPSRTWVIAAWAAAFAVFEIADRYGAYVTRQLAFESFIKEATANGVAYLALAAAGVLALLMVRSLTGRQEAAFSRRSDAALAYVRENDVPAPYRRAIPTPPPAPTFGEPLPAAPVGRPG